MTRTSPPFTTRGIVIGPRRFLPDWPERAAAAGLTTIALHGHPALACEDVVALLESDLGKRFLRRCNELGIHVEYEIHAMNYLLPRDLFDNRPNLFRMDESGQRTTDGNPCLSSLEAVDLIRQRAIALARLLPPTTNRYFIWPADGPSWCRCPRCVDFSDSDQALRMGNIVLEALRQHVHPQVTLAHLAYHNTLQPPTQVRPLPGIFLEFAPIRRKHDLPLATADETQAMYVDALKGNLQVFGAEGAQALEYWLDVSLFSNWKRPPVRLPDNHAVLKADLDLYASFGIQHITSFAVDIDTEYLQLHGEPPIDQYGAALL